MILSSFLVGLSHFSLFLFVISAFLTTSNAFFKFNNLNEVREKVDDCKLLLQSANGDYLLFIMTTMNYYWNSKSHNS